MSHRKNAFNIITDPERVRKILDGVMRSAQHLPSGFVPYILMMAGIDWNGRKLSSTLTIEGARPLSACTDGVGRRSYTLTNSDSNYTRSIGTIYLDEIQEIGLL